MYKYTRFAASLILAATVLIVAACTPNDKNDSELANGNSKSETDMKKSVDAVELSKSPQFADIAEVERNGNWLGGSPPINKRASGINTYYKISATSKAKTLRITMQFEGVRYDDALITLNTLDGAEILKHYPLKWRLQKDAVSEITFEVSIPDTISYLNIHTFQNARGASRAFLLTL